MSSAEPPTSWERSAPTIVAGTPPISVHRATSQSTCPLWEYSRAPTTAAGIVAGSGDATAAKPDRPDRDSSGVAKDDPPTPKKPKSVPTTTPDATIAIQCTAASALGGWFEHPL